MENEINDQESEKCYLNGVEITKGVMEILWNELPHFEYKKEDLDKTSLVQILIDTGLSKSKTEARNDIKSGAISIYNPKTSQMEKVK